MEAGRIGGGEQSGHGSQPAAARNGNLYFPFPVSPKGKAGAGGFPPRRKNSGSPRKRAKPPCAIPQKDAQKISLTEVAFSWKLPSRLSSGQSSQVQSSASSLTTDCSCLVAPLSRFYSPTFRASIQSQLDRRLFEAHPETLPTAYSAKSVSCELSRIAISPRR